MIDIVEFIKKMFKKEEPVKSRHLARERLKLVLVSDRVSISPRLIDSLREEIIEVISRYMTIDTTSIQMGVERKDGSLALAANIPILNVRRDKANKLALTPPPQGEKNTESKAEPVQDETKNDITTNNDCFSAAVETPVSERIPEKIEINEEDPSDPDDSTLKKSRGRKKKRAKLSSRRFKAQANGNKVKKSKVNG